MLWRILVFAFIAYVIWRWLRQIRSQPKSQPSALNFTEMVRCARCGLHLPSAQAVQHLGQPYCCVEHANQGPRD